MRITPQVRGGQANVTAETGSSNLTEAAAAYEAQYPGASYGPVRGSPSFPKPLDYVFSEDVRNRRAAPVPRGTIQDSDASLLGPVMGVTDFPTSETFHHSSATAAAATMTTTTATTTPPPLPPPPPPAGPGYGLPFGHSRQGTAPPVDDSSTDERVTPLPPVLVPSGSGMDRGSGNAYHPPQPVQVYRLPNNLDATIPQYVRESVPRDDQGRVLFSTVPPAVTRAPRQVQATPFQHSERYLRDKHIIEARRAAQRKERERLYNLPEAKKARREEAERAAAEVQRARDLLQAAMEAEIKWRIEQEVKAEREEARKRAEWREIEELYNRKEGSK